MEPVFQIGTISSIDYKKGCADVVLEDEEREVITDLPFFSLEYRMPSVSDNVVIAFQRSGNQAQGFILGPIYGERNRPECSGKGNYYKKFSEKAYLKYDAETETLELSAPHVIVRNLNECE